ncbi:MAG: glycoside hydrolase family 130 protein [Acidimicrobiales bacterium]|jgi:predicted GH43/DUF377 family glycosyl hydrolase
MLFVPGAEGLNREQPRTSAVVNRILALDDEEVQRSLDDVTARFANRHRDLIGTFRHHAEELTERLDPHCKLSETRQLLLGATFTSEYALEGAALCNPSMVAHPDQSGVSQGSLRFVMSVRAIGEGHRSSIEFRTGTIDEHDNVSIDPAPRFATRGATESVMLDAGVFRSELHRLRGDGETADYVLGALGEQFSHPDLEKRLGRLRTQLMTHRQDGTLISLMHQIAERSYVVRFPSDTSLSERVLMPAMGAERNGMEDARFVRFEHRDGITTYYGTYTAYDGVDVVQQLLETTDFLSFTASPVVGLDADKGLALFPRRVGGRFAALSRSGYETNTVVFSDDLHRWEAPQPYQVPTWTWEVLQLGNCGSPIETEAGWLALTHGVGPMRTYRIGAVLLDLHDPTKIIGKLREPLLSPAPDEQDGYVPNVVYSCGSLVHGDTLVLPYGIGDSAIRVATLSLPALLDALTAS